MLLGGDDTELVGLVRLDRGDLVGDLGDLLGDGGLMYGDGGLVGVTKVDGGLEGVI